MSEQRQETNTGTQSTNLSVRPFLIEILIFLDSLDTTLLFFFLSHSCLLAILCRLFVLYLSIAIWISQGLVLSSLHSILISWVFFLYFPPNPQGVQSVSFEPSRSPQTRQDVRVPPQLGSTTSLRREHSLQGCPSWWSQRRPPGGCWRGQERGLACTQVEAWLTSLPPPRVFLTTVMVLLSFALLETHVHISSPLLKLNCVCIAKF